MRTTKLNSKNQPRGNSFSQRDVNSGFEAFSQRQVNSIKLDLSDSNKEVKHLKKLKNKAKAKLTVKVFGDLRGFQNDSSPEDA